MTKKAADKAGSYAVAMRQLANITSARAAVADDSCKWLDTVRNNNGFRKTPGLEIEIKLTQYVQRMWELDTQWKIVANELYEVFGLREL